jgi:hypothetical protein
MGNFRRTVLNRSNRELMFSLFKELPGAVAQEFISIEALWHHKFAAFERGTLQSFSTTLLASPIFLVLSKKIHTGKQDHE